MTTPGKLSHIIKDGCTRYFKGDLLHRVDGPAVIHASGTMFWYVDNKLHRNNGPAIEYNDGCNFWYLHGTEYTFNRWLELTDLTNKEKTIIRLKQGVRYEY